MVDVHIARPVSGQQSSGPTGFVTRNEMQTAIGAVGTQGAKAAAQRAWKPEFGVYPVAGSSMGDLVADSGIVSGDLPGSSTAPALNTTGMVFVPYTQLDQVTGDPIFNFQGMLPTAAPAGILTAAGRSCLLNASSPRWNLGATGQYLAGAQSIRVGINSSKVVPVWYCGQGQLAGTVLDQHVMVEHNGENKHLSSNGTAADGLPRTATGGSGTYRRELTYVDPQYREHRFLGGANHYFIGVWIDVTGSIRRPKNRPQCWVNNVDSWNDAQTWSQSQGYTWPTADYQCLPMCAVQSFISGMAWGSDSQGGTGEINANGTSGGDASNYTGNRSSAAWSDSRCLWRANWWSQQWPIYCDIGGWNDGSGISGLGTPYRDNYRTRVAARIQKTIDACVALGRDARFANVGIQPVDISGTSDLKYLAALGQSDIPALFPNNVIGHVALMDMWWRDTSTSGARSVVTWTSDHIHLNALGDRHVGNWFMEHLGEMVVDSAYTNNAQSAVVPLLAIPTS